MGRTISGDHFAAFRAVLLVCAVCWLPGCYMNGMGCQPGDDTETCCLKEHPGV
jgi:hypothetical protein